jgi:hypothetical protein
MLMFNPCEEINRPWKCKTIIHIFSIPIFQRVEALELNLKPTRSYKYRISGRKTHQGTIFASICIFIVRVYGQNMGPKMVLEMCHSNKLMLQIDIFIDAPRNREISVATGGPDKPLC